MGRVVVDVMPKPEILDPQGKAVANALPRLGFTGFTGVRQGKRFELEVDGAVTPEVLEAARRAAETLLSNPVIEDVVRVADAAEHDGGQGHDGGAHDGGAHDGGAGGTGDVAARPDASAASPTLETAPTLTGPAAGGAA